MRGRADASEKKTHRPEALFRCEAQVKIVRNISTAYKTQTLTHSFAH